SSSSSPERVSGSEEFFPAKPAAAASSHPPRRWLRVCLSDDSFCASFSGHGRVTSRMGDDSSTVAPSPRK
ncbi:unnamed protein product, partial [Linum tenue]